MDGVPLALVHRGNNGQVVIAEAALVIGLVGAAIYAVIRFLTPPKDEQRPASSPGSWRTAHYDRDGETRVVLEKLAPNGASVLDDHVVAAVRLDDPEYDDKFLTAMSTARERRALFEAEEE